MTQRRGGKKRVPIFLHLTFLVACVALGCSGEAFTAELTAEPAAALLDAGTTETTDAGSLDTLDAGSPPPHLEYPDAAAVRNDAGIPDAETSRPAACAESAAEHCCTVHFGAGLECVAGDECVCLGRGLRYGTPCPPEALPVLVLCEAPGE